MTEDALADFVRDEQVLLWSDLEQSIRRTHNKAWSIECANIAIRLVRAAHLVNPTPMGEIPYSLAAGGVYEAVCEVGQLIPSLPDEQEWQRFDQLMASRRLSRAICRPRFAATVAAIRSPKEAAYIRDAAEPDLERTSGP
jgi:hypothetical protein